ncbi:MAG: hypothetical protein GX031_13200, partial [Candidatus Riflebacteria bacterium]|nr:hypothetical protein [Candidatus Riflebacteria bacterium]
AVHCARKIGDFEAAKALLFDESAEHTNANADNPEAQALKARILGITDGFEKAQSMFFDLVTGILRTRSHYSPSPNLIISWTSASVM